MSVRSRPIAALAVLGCLAGAPAGALAGSPARPRAAGTSAAARALLRSRELWATIDVCNAPDQPNVLGVRGSMPGDAQAHDTMYMRFRLQYLDKTTMRWVNLAASGASTPFLAVGGGASSRQDGSSFVIAPVAGQPAFMLRGVVAFQWRRGRTVLESITRPTTAGHQALAGADPAGFSAASCQIG